VEEPPEGVISYGTALMHPGIPDPMQPEQEAKDVAVLPFHIATILERSFEEYPAPMVMYAYDVTLAGQSDFLGGAEYFYKSKGTGRIRILPEVSLETLTRGGSRLQLRDLEILDRKWKIVYAAPDHAFVPTIIYILLGGILIMSAGLFLSVWVYTNADRQNRMNQLRAQTESEKAAVIIEAAQKAMRGERELNDFIAHEVRNPLAAAMSASSFVAASVNDEVKPFSTLRAAVNDDLRIIDNALHFINDLLRNMLDMQRAHSNQLSINYAPVDILKDVFSPVDAMLYRRGNDIQVQVECPPNLVIVSDRLRLKQIVLNLGRNSLKFVNKGFIRLRAAVDDVDNSVLIYIEDSGPGIPLEKRKKLFAKFQESLDSLHQGTGIGLCLCLNLMDLMGGEIMLDEEYDSGIPGQPGTRFVIRLNCPPLSIKDICLEDFQGGTRHLANTGPEVDAKPEGEFDLPNDLSLLFVDDDMVLRKLFARAIGKIMPQWKFQEAANGEAALKLIEGNVNEFDLIFVDQYMASAEKQLLGTETVRAMRAMGVPARICGLSANDVQHGFEDAGANAFMFKPFPTKPEAMKLELTRILACRPEDGTKADDRLGFQKPRESLPDDNQTSSLRKRVSLARDPISEVL
jgi:signal transduction histidine kinase